jgi:hypothetical protein
VSVLFKSSEHREQVHDFKELLGYLKYFTTAVQQCSLPSAVNTLGRDARNIQSCHIHYASPWRQVSLDRFACFCIVGCRSSDFLTFFFDEDFAAGWSSVFVGVSSVDVTGFGRILGLLDVLGGFATRLPLVSFLLFAVERKQV